MIGAVLDPVRIKERKGVKEGLKDFPFPASYF